MEQEVNCNVDLFSEALPSLAQIQEFADYINSSSINKSQFAEQIEQNMSLPGPAVGIGLCILDRFNEAIEKLHSCTDCKEKFLYISKALKNAGRYDEAIVNLDNAPKQGADTLQVNMLKIEIYRAKGDLEAAEKQLRECANFEGVSADYHYQAGRLCEDLGQYEKAVDNYAKAIELSPEHREALFHMAYRCDMCGDEEAAIDYYKKAVASFPAHVNALLNLAVLYEDNGKYEKALACVDKVLEFHPGHERARLFEKDISSSMTMYYDEEKEKRRTKKNQILETPISDFELSVRSRNCLKKMNIFTLGDLLNISESELLSYKNFGETSLREIKAILETKGLHLGQSINDISNAEQPESVDEVEDGMLSKTVDELQLSVRAKKCLSKLNIRTLGELTRRTEAELLGCKNFGVTSLNEIKKAIVDQGLSLRKLE